MNTRRFALPSVLLAVPSLVFALAPQEQAKTPELPKPDFTKATPYKVLRTIDEDCRYLAKSKIPISLEDAKKRYGPCSVCNPPIK